VGQPLGCAAGRPAHAHRKLKAPLGATNAVEHNEPAHHEITPQAFADVRTSDFNPYYGLAGHFVRWLTAELGAEDFAELYRTANYEYGPPVDVWLTITPEPG
jgi:hypothetical protein